MREQLDVGSVFVEIGGMAALRDGERRYLLDRRERPTNLWSTFRWRGRRRQFRRAGEDRNQYVDCLSGRVIALSLFIFFLSVLDAWFTLLHIQTGAIEANPIMSFALVEGGPSLFLGIKTWFTGFGVAFLAVHQNFRVSSIGLNSIAVLYTCLLTYHVLLLFAKV